MQKKQHTLSAQTATIKQTMGTAMTKGRLTPEPEDWEGSSSETEDDGSGDCVKILLGLMGNASPAGVRKWQL